MVVARHLKIGGSLREPRDKCKTVPQTRAASYKAFRCPRGGLRPGRQFFRAQLFNRIGQRFRTVFLRPRFLVVTNNPIHVTAANSHHRRAARLTFQRHKSKCFLNARMNEKIGGAIVTGEISGICAVRNPRDVSQLRRCNF